MIKGNRGRMKKLEYIILALLVLALGTGALVSMGCAGSSTSVTEVKGKDNTSKLAVNQNDIPIQGAITHVHEPDNSSITIIDIVIGKEFKDNLPEEPDQRET
jgi:hypothetical protein